MRVYGVVSSHTEDAPLLKGEENEIRHGGQKLCLTAGLTADVVALTTQRRVVRVECSAWEPSSLAEKCEDLNAIHFSMPVCEIGRKRSGEIFDLGAMHYVKGSVSVRDGP